MTAPRISRSNTVSTLANLRELRFMSYPRKITDRHLERMKAIMRVRLAPGNLGNQQIAVELNLSLSAVNRWMSRIRKEFARSNPQHVPISSEDVSC